MALEERRKYLFLALLFILIPVILYGTIEKKGDLNLKVFEPQDNPLNPENVTNQTSQNETTYRSNPTDNETKTGNLTSPGGGPSHIEKVQGCGAIADEDRRDWCYREKAVREENLDICKKIENSYYRDSCYRYIAIEKENATYCEYMQNEDREDWCKKAVEAS